MAPPAATGTGLHIMSSAVASPGHTAPSCVPSDARAMTAGSGEGADRLHLSHRGVPQGVCARPRVSLSGEIDLPSGVLRILSLRGGQCMADVGSIGCRTCRLEGSRHLCSPRVLSRPLLLPQALIMTSRSGAPSVLSLPPSLNTIELSAVLPCAHKTASSPP